MKMTFDHNRAILGIMCSDPVLKRINGFFRSFCQGNSLLLKRGPFWAHMRFSTGNEHNLPKSSLMRKSEVIGGTLATSLLADRVLKKGVLQGSLRAVFAKYL